MNNFIDFIQRNFKYMVLAFVALLVYLMIAKWNSKSETSTLESNTDLIQQQIRNVGKLVVTEGRLSEVLTYKDQKKYMLDVLTFEKKALLVVNSEVTISYDMRKIKYDIDERNKTITIKDIPEAEVKISPDIKFYDVEQSQMNSFTGEDYNKINKTVRANLAKKIEKSTLKSNAENRLVSELSKFLILTNTMGWTLKYNEKAIATEMDFRENIKH